MRDGRRTVTWPDVLQARYLRRVGEHEAVEFLERERHALAIHEACHAVSAYLLRRAMLIDTKGRIVASDADRGRPAAAMTPASATSMRFAP